MAVMAGIPILLLDLAYKLHGLFLAGRGLHMGDKPGFLLHDLPLAAAVCRTVRYIQLCREKLQEEQIAKRWQSIKLEEEF